MDLNLLVVFDAVAGARSVTLAAERLALSQPAVSHALTRLRNLVGDPLFLRGPKGLTLTARADALAAPVRAILAEIGAVLAPSEFDPARATRAFRIAVSDFAASAVLPGLIRSLRRLAPQASLSAQPFDGRTFGRLETGDLDGSFWGGGPVEEPFRARKLFEERSVGLVAGDHPLAAAAREGAVSLDAFLAYPHVAVTVAPDVAHPVDIALREIGRTRRVALSAPYFSANFGLLTGTDLVMAAPSRLTFEAERLGLARFELPLSLPVTRYAFVWHRRTDADAANLWLRDAVAESCAGGERL